MSRRRSIPASGSRGFTLVELLVVVLIIGILAAIALPRFLGQRTRAKNAAAQSAARHALVAARSYYTQNSESYAGLGPSELKGYESSLSGTEPADGQQPGASGANPQDIWIGNGVDGNNPTSGDANSGKTVVLCSVSKGNTVYCVKDASGVASYLSVTSTTVLAAAGGSFSASGWGSTTTASPPANFETVISSLSPTAFWKLDESSGSPQDSSGNGYHLTLTGTRTYSQRSLIPSLSSSSSILNQGTLGIGYANYPMPPAQYSWLAVIARQWTDNQYRRFFGRYGYYGSAHLGFEMGVYSATDANNPAAIFWNHWGGTNATLGQLLSNSGAAYDTAYLVIGTYDGTSQGTGTMKMYVNGVLQTSQPTITSLRPDLATTSQTQLYLGGYDGISNWAHWYGLLDDMAFWTGRVLSASEVSSIYNAYTG